MYLHVIDGLVFLFWFGLKTSDKWISMKIDIDTRVEHVTGTSKLSSTNLIKRKKEKDISAGGEETINYTN